MRATKDAPRNPFCLLEPRHGLAEAVERGAFVLVKRLRVMGRPEGDLSQRMAMNLLGNGLSDVGQHEDALSVQEANLSMRRRLGVSAHSILVAQGNLASTYHHLGRLEESLNMRRDVYSGRLKLDGAEHHVTLLAANNYAALLCELERFEEAKALLCKTVPVARRVLGESDGLVFKMRTIYARILDSHGAPLDDLREAVTTLEEIERISRRVLGGSHPDTGRIEWFLRTARANLRARETPSTGPA